AEQREQVVGRTGPGEVTDVDVLRHAKPFSCRGFRPLPARRVRTGGGGTTNHTDGDRSAGRGGQRTGTTGPPARAAGEPAVPTGRRGGITEGLLGGAEPELRAPSERRPNTEEPNRGPSPGRRCAAGRGGCIICGGVKANKRNFSARANSSYSARAG